VITLSHDREIDSAMWSVLTALDFLNAMLLTDKLNHCVIHFARPISEG
jgi:hypothetical protein